jgi:serine/threonine protein kinase
MLSGTGYMHRQGILHSDIKPENILLRYDSSQQQGPTLVMADLGSGYAIDGPPGELSYLQTKLATQKFVTPMSVVAKLDP